MTLFIVVQGLVIVVLTILLFIFLSQKEKLELYNKRLNEELDRSFVENKQLGDELDLYCDVDSLNAEEVDLTEEDDNGTESEE